MVRKKDRFWEYVKESNGGFTCKFCERDFAGGATRIKSHLAGVKGRDIDLCTEVPEDAQAEAYSAIGGPSKKLKRSNAEEIKTPTSRLNDLPQNTMLEMCKKKYQSAVDKLLTQHVILNNIPFDVIQTSPFIRFVEGVANNSRIEVGEYVSNVKKSWVTTGCTLISNIWSDMKQRAFINIIAYSPKGAVFMNSFEVSKEATTGLYFKDIISSVIEEIGPDHVVQFIFDNAANFESVGDMLIDMYPWMYKARCVAREIQLLLKDIYEEVNWVRKVIDDAKLIVTCMYKHFVILSLMRAHTNKELKHPCSTRFDSNFLMLQSILNVESELRLLVASSGWRGLDFNKKDIAKEVTNIIQSTEFWKQGREVLLVLEPLVRVLRLVVSDGATAGYLYEAMERAKEAIQQCCGNNKDKYIQIWKLFESRRSQNIIHPIHAAAAFLNPAYMCSETFMENHEMKEGIRFILENLVAIEEKTTFIRQVELYRIKSSSLFTAAAMIMLEALHPRLWWHNCGDSIPILKKYAIRILSQSCSSSSCERNWSAFEAAQTKKRNRLESKMLDDLVYMRMNMMMMEKSNTSERQALEPIDLDKLNELPEYVDREQDKEEDTLGGVVENVNDDIINDASLIVRDHREELYKKHHPPSLFDEVWRLEKIDKDEAFHKRLSQENINTVKDFLILLFRDPPRLQKILGTDMSAKMWEVTVEHARTCVIDDKRIFLYCSQISQQNIGVVFNVVGQVMGLITEGQYVPIDKLSETEKADAHNLVISAFEHWEDVVSFDDEASLVGSSSHFTNFLLMMEKSNTSEGQDLEPIDLDKLNELPEYVDREQDKEDDTLGGVVENVNDDIINDASLIVRDHHEELYKKHHPPSLYDEVWRLEKIDKDEAFHKRLSQEKINTVKDFLILLFRDPPRLQNILGTGMSPKMWEVTVEHARTCVYDDKRIFLYCARISQQKTGVVFNVVGQVMRLITECQYVPIDMLSEIEKVDAHNLVIFAFKHWEEIVNLEEDDDNLVIFAFKRWEEIQKKEAERLYQLRKRQEEFERQEAQLRAEIEMLQAKRLHRLWEAERPHQLHDEIEIQLAERLHQLHQLREKLKDVYRSKLLIQTVGVRAIL